MITITLSVEKVMSLISILSQAMLQGMITNKAYNDFLEPLSAAKEKYDRDQRLSIAASDKPCHEACQG